MEMTLDSLKVELEGKCVKVYTDNQNAPRIIEVGSMNKEYYMILLLQLLKYVFCIEEL